MGNLDLRYLCMVIGNLTSIPIRLYSGENRIFYYSLVQLSKDPMELYRRELFEIRTNVGYFVTENFFYYGVINSADTKIIIGPTRQISGSDQELQELAFRSDVALEEREDFIRGIKSIVSMPLESIMQILCTINHVLNGEKLTLQDISIYDAEQDDLQKQLIEQQAVLDESAYSPEDQSTQNNHSSFQLEQTLMDMIRKGDTAALREWIASAPAVNGGKLAIDQLRQMKNTFIVTATLASRAAIRGGLDVDDAFSLSDSFIQKCELLSSPERIINLQYHMVLSFTERVERLRSGKNPSKLVIDVANYIQHHLSEAITAEAIAKSLYLSRPYLSRKFKLEAGESLTDFMVSDTRGFTTFLTSCGAELKNFVSWINPTPDKSIRKSPAIGINERSNVIIIILLLSSYNQNNHHAHAVPGIGIVAHLTLKAGKTHAQLHYRGLWVFLQILGDLPSKVVPADYAVDPHILQAIHGPPGNVLAQLPDNALRIPVRK